MRRQTFNAQIFGVLVFKIIFTTLYLEKERYVMLSKILKDIETKSEKEFIPFFRLREIINPLIEYAEKMEKAKEQPVFVRECDKRLSDYFKEKI